MSRDTLILERIHAGELTLDEYKGQDRDERLAALEASDAEILQKYSVIDMQKAVMAKLAAEQAKKEQPAPRIIRGVFRQNAVRFVAAAAVLCLAVMIPFYVRNSQVAESAAAGVTLEQAGSAERAKGVGPRMYLYRKEGDAAVRLGNRTLVSEGDVIQISYIASGAAYGAIISIDGNGCVTQHYPENGTKAAPLSSSGEVPLEHSYRLDDAPSFERFLLITSDRQFSTQEVEEAVASFQNAERAKSADFSVYLPEDAVITELLLLK